jgi:hypothetical protein
MQLRWQRQMVLDKESTQLRRVLHLTLSMQHPLVREANDVNAIPILLALYQPLNDCNDGKR